MNLIYEGNVEVTVKYKSYKKKNHGTKHLFRLFTSMITGEIVSSSSYPYYLHLISSPLNEVIDKPEITNHVNSALLKFYPQVHRYSNNIANKYNAIFDATILSEHLRNNMATPAEGGITLALVSQNENTILAAVTFNNEYYNALTQGHSAVIRWTMTIRNSEELKSEDDESETISI